MPLQHLQDLESHDRPIAADVPAEIGGESVALDHWVDDLDPAVGTPMCRVASASAADVDRAVAAAVAAAPDWAARAPSERGAILRRLGGLVRDHADALARIETRDTGKPLSQGRADVAAAARYFEFYGSVVEGFMGDAIGLGDAALAVAEPVPHGVTGHVVPWNYPAQISARSVGAALAAGNATVVKPAEEAPLSVLAFARLGRLAGLPDGVLNVVPGDGPTAGGRLTAHPQVDHVSFTGSVASGRTVAVACANRGRPVLLELGGKSAHLVLEGADLDRAVPTIARALLIHAGQTCTAGTRVVVARSLHAELVSRLATLLGSATSGRGLDDPQLGPLIAARQAERVEGFVTRAQADGATLVARGPQAADHGGFFVAPALFDGVAIDSELFREEVFGPVLAVTPVDSDDEAVAAAEATDYGLTAAVWCRDVDRALRTARRLRVGQASVNGYAPGGGVELPFGGVKDSGHGREKGVEALREYTQTRTLFVDLTG